MKFKSQPVYTYVQAEIFQNDEKSNQAISELLGDKLLDSSVENETLTVLVGDKSNKKDKGTSIEVKFGDFIVKNEANEIYSADAVEFSKEYELVKD